MNRDKVTTIEEDRPLTEREVALVNWLLRNGSAASLDDVEESVPHLRVVSRCGCGCASIDFEKNGQSCGAHPIAEATGKSPAGLSFGVILWGRNGAVTGLEIYEGHPGSADTLPSPESLTAPWGL